MKFPVVIFVLACGLLLAGCPGPNATSAADQPPQDPATMANPPHPDQGALGPADPQLQNNTATDGP